MTGVCSKRSITIEFLHSHGILVDIARSTGSPFLCGEGRGGKSKAVGPACYRSSIPNHSFPACFSTMPDQWPTKWVNWSSKEFAFCLLQRPGIIHAFWILLSSWQATRHSIMTEAVPPVWVREGAVFVRQQQLVKVTAPQTWSMC